MQARVQFDPKGFLLAHNETTTQWKLLELLFLPWIRINYCYPTHFKLSNESNH